VARFQLPFSHSQIAVFQGDLENPFNDWEDTHVDQGFSWREGSVSFSTLTDGGTIDVEVVVKKAWSIDRAADRIIRVPFLVSETGVEVASIISGQTLDIAPGTYSLYFETGMKENAMAWCRCTFVPDKSPAPEILKADKILRPRAELDMHANPAVP
jgi:hypothetical protein